jgi:hypothetical protein
MVKQVCSTTSVFHYFFDPSEDAIASVLRDGLRPLSDFPDSERWQQIEAAMPGFYENLYISIAQPIIQQAYSNSGVFLTPIDFYQMENTLLADKPRLRIPLSRLDAAWTCVTYVLQDERETVILSETALDDVAKIWTDDLVREWFGKDTSKLFFYVPQLAVYQAGGVRVEDGDLEYA